MKRRTPGFWIWSVVFAIFAGARVVAESPADPAVERWLAVMTNLTTWHAQVTQTRHLKALTQPLVAKGRVWFAAPDAFRWELGDPPQSLVLRSADELTILSPKLRRAERFPMTGGGRGPMNDLSALVDAGFPRDAASFKKRFELIDVTTNAASTVLRLRPQSAAARRMMPSIAVEVDSSAFGLVATEMTFADGSRLRNVFTETITNTPLSPGLFRTNLDSSWKVSDGGGAR